MMLLTINNLAKHYGLLPSQALDQGTTFDLYIMDLATRWEQRQHEIAQGKNPTPTRKKLTVEQMKTMIQRVKRQERERSGRV